MIRLCATWVMCGVFVLAPGSARAEIGWGRDFAAGMRLARESGRAVMVQFSAIWCPPCEKMERKVLTNRRLVELSERYVFIHVDVDYDPATAARYGVRGVPATVFLDPSGNELARRDGVSDAGTLLRILEGLPKGLPTRASGAHGR